MQITFGGTESVSPSKVRDAGKKDAIAEHEGARSHRREISQKEECELPSHPFS